MIDNGDETESPDVENIDDPEMDKDKATSAALKLLVAATEKARMSDDHARFDQLIHTLLEVGGSLPRDALGGSVVKSERSPQNSKDVWRIRVAIVLITGLLVAVIYAVYAAATQGEEPGSADGQTIAQYLSLVSGLAGISIGWLYGDRTQSS